MPAAPRKVALPSSTHSRLCLELLPGNRLDRAQACVCVLLSVCVDALPTPEGRAYSACTLPLCTRGRVCRICIPALSCVLVRKFHATLHGRRGDRVALFPDWIPRD